MLGLSFISTDIFLMVIFIILMANFSYDWLYYVIINRFVIGKLFKIICKASQGHQGCISVIIITVKTINNCFLFAYIIYFCVCKGWIFSSQSTFIDCVGQTYFGCRNNNKKIKKRLKKFLLLWHSWLGLFYYVAHLKYHFHLLCFQNIQHSWIIYGSGLGLWPDSYTHIKYSYTSYEYFLGLFSRRQWLVLASTFRPSVRSVLACAVGDVASDWIHHQPDQRALIIWDTLAFSGSLRTWIAQMSVTLWSWSKAAECHCVTEAAGETGGLFFTGCKAHY